MLRMALEPPTGWCPVQCHSLWKKRTRAVFGYSALEVELALLTLQGCFQVLLNGGGRESSAMCQTNLKYGAIGEIDGDQREKIQERSANRSHGDGRMLAGGDGALVE